VIQSDKKDTIVVNLVIFLTIIENRKWKNGYLIPLTNCFKITRGINWEFTDFVSEEKYEEWLKKNTQKG